MGEWVPDFDWVMENLEFRDIEHHPTYGPLLEQLLVKRFRAKMSPRALADRFGFPLSGVRRVLRRGGVTTCPQPEPTATPPPTSTDLDSCSDLDAPGPSAAREESSAEEMTTAKLSEETLGLFAKGIGEAMRFERNRRGWTRKEMRREMGTGRSLQTMATHELGTRAMSMCQFIEYCHVLDVAPGPMVDRVYRDVVDTRENAIVIADLDKLARSEYPNLAAWAEIRLRSLPASARGMLPLPRQAQDALAALCKFERRQLLEILGAA